MQGLDFSQDCAELRISDESVVQQRFRVASQDAPLYPEPALLHHCRGAGALLADIRREDPQSG